MGIWVLGPLTVDGTGELGRRDRVVLTSLATNPGRPVSADQLSEALWGEHPPASAPKVLQGCVVRLRKMLGREAVETSAQGYVLRLSAEDVDSLRFEDRIVRARELLTLGEPDRAAYLLTEALALWRGEPFTDLEGWVPAATVRRCLSELRLEAEELRVDALLRAGRFREVLSDAQALVREAPLRELRWGLLARAQYQSGQQGEALRTIRQLRRTLVEQLGIDPGPDVVALESSILRQDSSLLVADARTASTTCPWPGLRAYDVEDADRFFGRDRDLAACLEILARSPVLAVVGPSGSGKSSLVRAGVGAALRARGQSCRAMVPGEHPLDPLTSLSEAPRGTALLVDQLEELFSVCKDVDERAEFLRVLTSEAEHRTVVVALRADHLADLAGHPGFSRLVERGMYLVGGLDEEGLRTAVETPARQAGLVVEPGLVDLLVREVGNDPGALPLMSHALVETWRRREGSTLTVAGYRASGGINGAVAQSAEDLYSRVGVDQRRLLRDLVLRLVSPGLQGEPVRTRVPRRLVGTDPEHEQLIDMLVTARLVTSDDGALEITHEALTRAWPRLRGWLDDDLEGQRIRHHLSAAADAWEALGRPDSELYRGVRLVRAREWRDGRDATLTEGEQDFLEASSRHADAEQQTIVERARAQAGLIRRLRTALVGAAVLLVLALVAGGLAAVQSNRAGRHAAEARSAEDNARRAALAQDARQIGARALESDDVSLSLLLAAAAVRLDPSPESRATLLAAVGKRPRLVRSTTAGGGYLEPFDVSPDGRWIASSDDRGRMHLYDAATHRLLRTYRAVRPGGGQAFMIARFSPDSSRLAVILTGGMLTDPVRVLDPETMRPTTTLALARPSSGIDVQFSADGHHLAATLQTVDWSTVDPSGTSGFALVWDLRRPSAPPVRVPTGTGAPGVALSPDGRTLYTGTPLTAYDVTEGTRLWRRPDIITHYAALDIDAHGTLLAVERRGPCTGGDTLLVRASTGATVHVLRGQRGSACDIRFSPDGRLVGSVSADGELVIWSTASGGRVDRWQASAPWGIGFGPDGHTVYTGGGGGSMLRTWDLSAQDTYLRRSAHVRGPEEFAHADVSPDGRRVAYSWHDGETGWVRFVDTVTGRATPPARVHVSQSQWPSGTWHPQGRRYVPFCSMDECAAATVLDATTGRVVVERRLFAGSTWSMAYVDAGRRLLVGGSDVAGQPYGKANRTMLVDAETLQPEGTSFDMVSHNVVPIGDGGTAMVHELSSDLTTAHWRVIDVHSGQVLSEGDLDSSATVSDPAPDGSAVAVAGDRGEIVVIDVSTGVQRRTAGLGAPVRWLRYSHDGELLVSAADDGAVSLWDARTLDLLGTVSAPRPGDPVPAGAQFIGDSHDVAIASYDGTVYRWETDLERALDFACQMAGRDLTPREWAQFLPDQPYQSVCPDA